MVSLTKETFINLKKQAVDAVNKAGLGNQTAKVGFALDISGSMSNNFRRNVVQQVTERMLALGIKFDDNEAIDIFLFGVNDYEVGELTEDKFENYVDNKISKKYPLEGGTRYAGVIKRIMQKYVPGFDLPKVVETSTSSGGWFGFGKKSKTEALVVEEKVITPLDEPVYIIFVTDGDNSDHEAAEALIREASKYGVFWKFVGIGGDGFKFLKGLDNLRDRFIDNAHFIEVNDIANIDDEELFDRLLIEFPDWVNVARSKNLIK
jgi:hypothetical protein